MATKDRWRGCSSSVIVVILEILEILTNKSLPTVLGFPAMVFPVPPLVVLIPAMLAFGVQIAAAVFGFAAVIALVMDRFVQSDFGFFDRVLALRSVLGVRQRCRCYEPHKGRGHYRC
jgi:hypothetical protein